MGLGPETNENGRTRDSSTHTFSLLRFTLVFSILSAGARYLTTATVTRDSESVSLRQPVLSSVASSINMHMQAKGMCVQTLPAFQVHVSRHQSPPCNICIGSQRQGVELSKRHRRHTPGPVPRVSHHSQYPGPIMRHDQVMDGSCITQSL